MIHKTGGGGRVHGEMDRETGRTVVERGRLEEMRESESLEIDVARLRTQLGEIVSSDFEHKPQVLLIDTLVVSLDESESQVEAYEDQMADRSHWNTRRWTRWCDREVPVSDRTKRLRSQQEATAVSWRTP